MSNEKVIDCAGAMLTQGVVDFLLEVLREEQSTVVDIRLRNVNISRLPEITVEFKEQSREG